MGPNQGPLKFASARRGASVFGCFDLEDGLESGSSQILRAAFGFVSSLRVPQNKMKVFAMWGTKAARVPNEEEN